MTERGEFDDEYFEWEEREEEIPLLKHMICGSIAGIAEHVVFLPIDTIKTHRQSLLEKLSFIDTIRYIKKTGGYAKFYRGTSIMAIGCIPAHSIYFSIYEYSRIFMGLNDSNKLNFMLHAVTGILSTAFHDFILNPCDVLKQRAQLLNSKSYPKLIKRVIKQEGLISLWKSYPISYSMNVPNQAIIVGCNESFKQIWRNYNLKHNFYSYFGCASLAGMVSCFVTMPLDVIRTRINTQCDIKSSAEVIPKKVRGLNMVKAGLGQKLARANNPQDLYCECTTQRGCTKYNSPMETFRIILKSEGFRGFYKGFAPRAATQSMSTAIAWSTYEMMKVLVIGKNNQK